MRTFGPSCGLVASLCANCGPTSIAEVETAGTESDGAVEPSATGESETGPGTSSQTDTAGTETNTAGTETNTEGSDNTPTCVSGKVALAFAGTGPETLAGTAIAVTLEDVSVADGPSVELGRMEFVGDASTALPFPFEVCGEAHDPGADYTVGALLDLDVDGRPSRGDYLCVEVVPVINGGPTQGVEVPVVQVK